MRRDEERRERTKRTTDSDEEARILRTDPSCHGCFHLSFIAFHVVSLYHHLSRYGLSLGSLYGSVPCPCVSLRSTVPSPTEPNEA